MCRDKEIWMILNSFPCYIPYINYSSNLHFCYEILQPMAIAKVHLLVCERFSKEWESFLDSTHTSFLTYRSSRSVTSMQSELWDFVEDIILQGSMWSHILLAIWHFYTFVQLEVIMKIHEKQNLVGCYVVWAERFLYFKNLKLGQQRPETLHY